MQNYHDWELIIKDGGSVDNSLSVVPVDNRIKTIKQPDSGIFDAMNQAIKMALGKYICLLNAGDCFFETTALNAVAAVHIKYPNVDFLYGNVHKPGSRSGYEIYPSRLSRYFLFTSMICHQAWFVRKEYYIAAGGYETKCTTGGDYRYFLQMNLRDKVEYKRVPQVLIEYKGGGVSQDPQHIRNSRMWRDDARRLYFLESEIIVYSVIQNVTSLIKKLLYDPFLFRMWAFFQRKRIKSRRRNG